jgi:DNA-directed RNA polymerase subunit M/transcription elongation factor TFIIS
VPSLIGKDIEAFCTKCKIVLDHIILVDIDQVVSRVKCKTCGSEHRYRSNKPNPKKSSSSPDPIREKKVISGSSMPKRISTAPSQWENKKSEMKPNHLIKTYRTQDTFRLRDVIQHHAFGLGFVEQIISDTRMDVLFCDSIKRMVMNTEKLL